MGLRVQDNIFDQMWSHIGEVVHQCRWDTIFGDVWNTCETSVKEMWSCTTTMDGIVLCCGYETTPHIWWLDPVPARSKSNHHHQSQWLQWTPHPETIPDHQWWEYFEVRWLDLDHWVCWWHDQSIHDIFGHWLCWIYEPTKIMRYNERWMLWGLWMWSMWLSPKWRGWWLKIYTYPDRRPMLE